MTVICYKTKETTRMGDTFLAYYTCQTKEEAQRTVDMMNKNKPERNGLGAKINWNEIKYFFVNEQEEMK